MKDHPDSDTPVLKPHNEYKFYLSLLLRSSFYGRIPPAFRKTNCVCDRFQFPLHSGSHTPSSRSDLVCVVFLSVQRMRWLPALGVFDVGSNVNACDCSRGCANTVRESAQKVDSVGDKSFAAPVSRTYVSSAPDPTSYQAELHPWPQPPVHIPCTRTSH